MHERWLVFVSSCFRLRQAEESRGIRSRSLQAILSEQFHGLFVNHLGQIRLPHGEELLAELESFIGIVVFLFLMIIGSIMGITAVSDQTVISLCHTQYQKNTVAVLSQSEPVMVIELFREVSDIIVTAVIPIILQRDDIDTAAIPVRDSFCSGFELLPLLCCCQSGGI